MDVPVIKVGNSKGIRLKKNVLEKYGITDSLEMILDDDKIILKPKNPRQGWSEKFKAMHENGDDRLLIDDVFEDEEFEDWV